MRLSQQAPRVDGDSVQRIRVEVRGRLFKLVEERKVMFRSYYPLTFIQTDKPIYTPGQTGELKINICWIYGTMNLVLNVIV